MADIELVTLDAVTIDPDTKAPVIKATQPITDDEDVEAFGDLPLMQCLGVSSAPWGKDEGGYCEAAVARGVGGRDGVILGARDTRTNDIVGNLKPGDTVVHTTGPSKAAQLQLKEEKRQALLVTKTTDGKTAVCGLDGKNDKFSVALLGYMVEVSSANGICLVDKTGTAGIQIKDGIVSVFGTVVIGGRTPTAPLAMLTPPTYIAANAVPTPGVFYGK